MEQMKERMKALELEVKYICEKKRLAQKTAEEEDKVRRLRGEELTL